LVTLLRQVALMYLVALDQRQTDATAGVAQAFQLSQWAKEDGHVGKMDLYMVSQRSGNIQGTFREHSGNIQGTSSELLVLYGSRYSWRGRGGRAPG
jgi:hypothetical protein